MKKGLKKVLLGIVLSVMTLGALLLAGCSPVSDLRDQVDQLFCSHETTKIVKAVAPTCTEDGYTGIKKCVDCGKELTKGAVIKATGHNVKETKGYAATCETDGFTGGVKCENCDYAVSGEIIPALGHSYDDGAVTKEATCETDGEKTFTCATCEGTKVESIAATGHTFEDGTCTVCGATENAITYTVSGTWVFNETIEEPTVNLYEECIFDTSDDNYYGIDYWDMGSSTAANYFYYHNTSDYSDPVIAYSFGNNTWSGEAYRTITFDGEQPVSQEFYEWLVENAQIQIEAGAYIFKEILTEAVSVYDLEFSSNGNTYCGMGDPDGDLDLVYMTAASSGTKVYYVDSETWKDAGYKTIVVSEDQAVYKVLYDWFVENTLITFTIEGTQYQAERDMTWGEWVASEYNTGGFYAGATYIFVIQGSDKQQYYITNTWLEQTIDMNGGYVLEVFSGSEPT